MAAVPTIGRATGVERRPTAPEADATRALYEQYSRQILNYCVHQLNSREEAEDAVQTTFMNAFRGLKRGIVPEAEQAWLFKIAENVCLSRRRSSWRRGKVESPNDFEVLQEIVPSKHANRADELIGLEDALEAMPENQRRAILLREWQGLSYREIADELELSQAAVETLIFRARRSLAAGLESPVAPKRRRRISAAGDGLSLGSLIAGLKSILTGGAAVKAVAVAVAAGSATLAATQAEPALVHHLNHAPKTPARSVNVTKQSQATFSSQATVVARSSGMSVTQAHTQADRGAVLHAAVAAARPVTMPEEVTHAQAPPVAPQVPTMPAVPVPEAPVAAAPTAPAEQPKTEAPKTEAPKTGTPKTEPAKPADSPGKSGNGNDGKQADTPKAKTNDAPKAEPTKPNEGNAKAVPADAPPASDPPKSEPPKGKSDNQGNGNGNKTASVEAPKDAQQTTPSPEKDKGDKSKGSTPVTETPPAPVAPTVVPPVVATASAPVTPPAAPARDNGNGNNGDKGKGKGK